MNLAIVTNSFSYVEVSTMTADSTISRKIEPKLIVEPRLHISKEKLKRISDRALARYLAAAEKLTD